MFAPDAKALGAIEQDVLQPWAGYSLQKWNGAFARKGQRSITTLPTPLDGLVAVQLKGPAGSSLRLTGASHVKRASATLAGVTICGQRSLTMRVTAGRAGRFSVTSATP
jgi:hypothetical protein